MYESPIDIIYNDIQYKVVEEMDKNVVSAVQSYGIDVNKEELLKALRYDRQQYEKGYADAKAEQRWIPCSEKLPEKADGKYWVCTDTEYQCQCRWTDDVYGLGSTGEWAWKIFDIPQYSHVVAWMPLPEPYEGGEG